MPSSGPQTLSRYHGSLLGAAVCDALGAPVEFKRPGSFPKVTDFLAGGTWGLPAGAWTDDTSMLLCLAESLVERQGFDAVDQLERYCLWYRKGHLSSVGRCFDIGSGTRAALHRFERTREPECGEPHGGGNGGLMRLAPVPLAFARDAGRAIDFAALSSRTTHGASEASDAARYFAGLIVGAVRGESKETLLAEHYCPVPGLWDREPLHPKVVEISRGSFKRKQPPQINAGGYVIPALEAALWAFHTTTTFESGAIAAVNLGDDSDSVGCIFGQLAGAYYGVEGIPERWLSGLVKRDLIEGFAHRLHKLAEAWNR